MNKNLHKPDFLIIGAQKAGTSWIYQNLKNHPEIWTPPVKEFHFFDEYERRLNKNKTSDPITRKSYFNRKIKVFLKSLYLAFVKMKIKYIRFGFLYAFTTRGLSKKLMKRYILMFDKNKISGDITPAYATLSEETIIKIREYLLNLKVIFVLRNPVERFWSETRMRFRDNLLKNRLEKEEITKFLNKNDLRNDYIYTIDLWSKYFGGNFNVMFYDELVEKPDDFLRKIHQIIGVTPKTNVKKQDKGIVGKGLKAELSKDLLQKLYNHFYSTILEIHNRYSHISKYPECWLKKADEILEKK